MGGARTAAVPPDLEYYKFKCCKFKDCKVVHCVICDETFHISCLERDLKNKYDVFGKSTIVCKSHNINITSINYDTNIDLTKDVNILKFIIKKLASDKQELITKNKELKKTITDKTQDDDVDMEYMNQTLFVHDDEEEDSDALQNEITFCRHSNNELKRENQLLENLYNETRDKNLLLQEKSEYLQKENTKSSQNTLTFSEVLNEKKN